MDGIEGTQLDSRDCELDTLVRAAQDPNPVVYKRMMGSRTMSLSEKEKNVFAGPNFLDSIVKGLKEHFRQGAKRYIDEGG